MRPRQDVMDKLWLKYFPATFQGVDPVLRLQKALNESKEAEEVMKTTVQLKPKTSSEVAKIVKENVEKVEKIAKEKNLSLDTKNVILKELQTMIHTDFGSRNELVTATKVEKEGKEKGKTWEVDRKTYTHRLCNLEGIEYILRGKVDGIETDPLTKIRTIVEIKNRVNKITKEVAPYDMIQIQSYLHLLNLTNAKLIQQRNQKTTEIAILRDRKTWHELIFPQLLKFCEEFSMRRMGTWKEVEQCKGSTSNAVKKTDKTSVSVPIS